MYTRYRGSRCNNCQCSRCRQCKKLPVMPDNPRLANSYVPYQYLDDFFDPCEALENGTAFPELVSPYVPNQSQCMIKYLEGTKTCEEVGLDGD